LEVVPPLGGATPKYFGKRTALGVAGITIAKKFPNVGNIVLARWNRF